LSHVTSIIPSPSVARVDLMRNIETNPGVIINSLDFKLMPVFDTENEIWRRNRGIIKLSQKISKYDRSNSFLKNHCCHRY
jgi:hypothetical protein